LILQITIKVTPGSHSTEHESKFSSKI